jgi:hypothetical protein
VEEKIDRMEKNIVMWLHRGLTLEGKILILKTFGISQLIYTMQMCEYRPSDLVRIERMIFKFLWNKKWNVNKTPERIKRQILKQDYSKGGLTVPDISSINMALKLKQFLRSLNTKHPISIIQKYYTEELDYDNSLQQEYSRITDRDEVILTAQLAMNSLTDKMRIEIEEGQDKPIGYREELIASTDILEYLKRKNQTLALCYYKRLFSLGIESFKQLFMEYKYPRCDQIKSLAVFVLRSFPKSWIDIIERNWQVEGEVELSLTLPLGLSLPGTAKLVTAKQIRKQLLEPLNVNHQDKYKVKFGTIVPESVNPFIRNREVNRSTEMRMFKYRLLHCDIYCKERMFKFKMVDNENCDHCGLKETIKHLFWECSRAKKVWDFTNKVLSAIGNELIVEFDNILIGTNEPGSDKVESLITVVAKTLLTREREDNIPINLLKYKILQHCIINLRLAKDEKNKAAWEVIRTIVENVEG